MSVSSNRNLDIGAGRGDGTLVVLTHIQSRKRRLDPLMDAFIAPSRNPEIALNPFSLMGHSSCQHSRYGSLS